MEILLCNGQKELKGFSIERMRVELPAKKHDQFLPFKYLRQLQELAVRKISKQREAFVEFSDSHA